MKNSLEQQNKLNLRQIPDRPGVSSDVGLIRVGFILSAWIVFCLFLFGCDSQEQGEVASSGLPLAPSEMSRIDRNEGKDPDEIVRDQAGPLPKIVAFGDSLTAGSGVSPDQSYPAQLEKTLQAAGYRYNVVNAGVSGETTAGGVRRVGWILKSQPTYVIVELGANDALRGQSLEQSYHNLKMIIEGLQEEGVGVILAGMKIPLNYGEIYTKEFEGMYGKLAAEYQIPLIPFFLEGVAAQRDLNQGDGIHPTGEGYVLVVKNVWKVLEPLLKQGEIQLENDTTPPKTGRGDNSLS